MRGSHNSMTYLPPNNILGKLINFTSQCQEVDLMDQYDKGIRFFDIRIAFNDKDEPIFKHGLVTYKGDVFNTLYILRYMSEVSIRVILETTNENIVQETLFIKFCSKLKEMLPNITIYGGNRKYDWKQIYPFKEESLITHKEASMSKYKVFHIFPKLYAKLFNRHIKESSNNIILYDFINI